MPRLTKAQLLQQVQQAIADAGWDVEVLSERNVHPIELRIKRGKRHHTVRVYIWNLSYGGKPRSRDEYRIQVTGVSRFERMTGEQTLILGWSEEFGTFCGFDYDRHAGPLGSSPSLQISKGALEAARDYGVAARTKGNNEIAVAVRPDFLASYIEQRAQLHNPAEAQATVEALRHQTEPQGATDVVGDLDHFVDRLRGGAAPQIGSDEEREQRRAVLDRLAALEKEIERIRAQPGMIGHNRPPPDDDGEPDIASIDSAARTIAEELQREVPDAAKVAEKAGLLERVARAWRTLANEAAEIGKVVKDKARERLAETMIGGAIATGGMYHQQLGALAHDVAVSVSTWLGFILP